ncbi:tetratricopeptide repeat protein [Pseudanabaenaceae cyanobacterium LEGE 13415]|nr:tetratricopeptide repeat protein [Pseudanabaenaceae cyanobacterium LEGE 13415]
MRKNRWLLNLVLIVATVGLLGVTMLPLITSAIGSNSQAAKPSPSPSGTATPQKADIEARARGYEEVLKREPENTTALRGLLEARLQLNDVKGVIDPLEKLAKLNPNQTEYGVLLAQAKQQLNDPEGAAEAYRSILQSKPGDLNALAGLSDLLIKQKRPEAAIGLLQDTIKQAPTANKTQANSVDTTAVQVLLGKVFASQKRYDEALATFDEATKTNANDFQPVLYKALVLKEQGKNDEAKPLFDKAASLAPAQFKDQITRLSTAQPPAPQGDSTTSPTTPPAGVTPVSPAPAQSSPAPAPKN